MASVNCARYRSFILAYGECARRAHGTHSWRVKGSGASVEPGHARSRSSPSLPRNQLRPRQYPPATLQSRRIRGLQLDQRKGVCGPEHAQQDNFVGHLIDCHLNRSSSCDQ